MKQNNNRIRIVRRDSIDGSVYHCVSRTVNKEFWWDEPAKEVLRRQIRKVAAFCGVDILAYCLMSNHFHILVRVVTGRSSSLTNEELLERLRRYYNNPEDELVLERLQSDLLSEEEMKREATRKMLLARMDDLSNFMKILKQRFSIWYNRRHHRIGPHWCDRFQSVLVEDSRSALRAVAGYIALNPVRAGICRDPKDYRHSSYTEALVGDAEALRGLLAITGERDYQSGLAEFRKFLYRTGEIIKADGSGRIITPGEANIAKRGEEDLSISMLLYSKIRHFTQGVAIGGTDYLRELVAKGVVKTTRRTRPRAIAHQELQSFRG